MITKEIQDFLLKEAVSRFIRYVKIWTTSDEESTSSPSTDNQLELGKILTKELNDLGLEKVIHDEYGYVYAFLPASYGLENKPTIGFLAHLDTSESVSGKEVRPVIRKNYDGKEISFTSNEDLKITLTDSPELEKYIGLDIITSEGDTLLGADDKAGVAEIMTACAAFGKYPEFKHGPIMVCFTPDEEVGRGTEKIDLKRLPEVCYTLDGSEMGELEFECFDAWKANFKFKGLSVHPGHAKNKMVNAIQIASRFFSDFPEYESPEHTEEREGYYHLITLNGTSEEAQARVIIRDFELGNNRKRMEFIENLKQIYEIRYPGLEIELQFEHQYQNMFKYIEKNEEVINLAKQAIEKTGLELKIHPIRGGTDGARLSEKGIPTPNIFAGGLLLHSRKEYIPTLALQKAAEVIIHLANLWVS